MRRRSSLVEDAKQHQQRLVSNNKVIVVKHNTYIHTQELVEASPNKTKTSYVAFERRHERTAHAPNMNRMIRLVRRYADNQLFIVTEATRSPSSPIHLFQKEKEKEKKSL
jgi:hypothetical protein